MYNKEKKDLTVIRVKKSTRDQLLSLGKKNQTYEDVIKKLLDFYFQNDGIKGKEKGSK